jgi:NAD(P)H-hydrate epimerase
MKIFTPAQLRKADQYTIENEPISSIDLMERAASQLFNWFTENISNHRSIHVFCGMGNNGGDGLALARMLHYEGYHVLVYILHYTSEGSPDFQQNLERLKQTDVAIREIGKDKKIKPFAKGSVVVDAIFGSGLNRAVDGWLGEIIEYLNWQDAIRVAVDIPSGLFAEKNDGSTGVIIQADFTLTFQFYKLSFMFPENEQYVGNVSVLPIGISEQFIVSETSHHYVLVEVLVKSLLKKRTAFSHKGTFGHACIAAGAKGKMGAAVLATKSCLRSGVGLTTAHIPQQGLMIMQISVPEAMCIPDDEPDELNYVYDYNQYNALGVGPGIGTSEVVKHWLWNTLKVTDIPTVIDADALNILSAEPDWLDLIPEGSILTPHLGEFKRLVGDFKSYERLEKLKEFAQTHNVVVVLKGKHSTIACPDGEILFNDTGNPGMATGGMGDALTGLLTGLLAQGYDAKNAACIGVYLHGRAGDIAASFESQQALTAGTLIEYVGDAWIDLSPEA